MDSQTALKAKQFYASAHFAVVGASADSSKYGSKIVAFLADRQKDVVPINPNRADVRGLKCLKSLSELPDPTHTSVCIVVPPAVTLQVLQQAKALGIPSLWLQPGAEDDTVLKFIEADAGFESHCLYSTTALHQHPLSASHTSVSFEAKKNRFFAAKKFAVVGASADEKKFGTKALQYLIKVHRDVVPINITASHSQGIPCLKSLADLPDPTNTSICIVIPPKVGPNHRTILHPKLIDDDNQATLQVVQQAKQLGIYALWIQPGAEDADVVRFIEADPELEARSLFRQHPLPTVEPNPATGIHDPIDVSPPPAPPQPPVRVIATPPESVNTVVLKPMVNLVAAPFDEPPPSKDQPSPCMIAIPPESVNTVVPKPMFNLVAAPSDVPSPSDDTGPPCMIAIPPESVDIPALPKMMPIAV
ncbi:unnamed protein product [Mycena citricolor]|uniref:CoA-binding domain-containing protein n=1 Tax=Mycena citricolor TaxID=2018698 RepID=A0AAD2K7Z7_9AGAR|nr:unnamed protein product [Mycena citricolor]